ncbi:MAG: hypothetical protein AB3N63_13045 [Puniceicoccaceae bacterium]
MRKFLLIAIILPILLGFVSIPLLLPVAKSVRAQQHYRYALQMKEDGDHKGAFQRILSASNLTPDNPEVLSRLGPYASAVQDPDTLALYMRAAEANLLELDDIIDMVDFGISSQQTDIIQPYLYQITHSNPEDVRIQALQLRFLRARQRIQETSVMARNLVEDGVMDTDVLSSYVQNTMSARDVTEEEKAEVIATLHKAAGSADDVGIFSLRSLMQLWGMLEPADKSLLQQKLRISEQATLQDHLRLLSLLKADGTDPIIILGEANTVYQQFQKMETAPEPGREGTSTLSLLVDWLSQEGFHEQVLNHLPDAEKIEDSNLFFIRQVALIQMGDAAEARDSTFEDNPLNPTRNLVLRTLSLIALGRLDTVEDNLSLAIESVQIEDLAWLEQILLNLRQFDLILNMYEGFEAQMVNPLPVQIRLIPYYYQLKRETDLRRVVGEISIDDVSNSLYDQVSTLYFISLYRTDLPGARRRAESLVTDYPNLFEPRLHLGFAYTLSGQAPLAMELIQGWENFNASTNRTVAIMLSAILAANGKTDEARALIKDIPVESLLDQERALVSGLI